MRTGWTWHARAPPADKIRTMIRKLLSAVFASVFAVFAFVFAVSAPASARREPERATARQAPASARDQSERAMARQGRNVPRPPVIKITPDSGSEAPDGYA